MTNKSPKNIEQFIAQQPEQALKKTLKKLSLEELITIIHTHPFKKIVRVFYILDAQVIVSILKSLTQNIKIQFIQTLTIKRLKEILPHMESDDLTDLLLLAPEQRCQEILQTLDKKHKETIQELASYPKNTAGSLMKKEYLRVQKDLTVNETILSIRSQKKNKHDHYILVTNNKGQLEGTLSFRKLILALSNQPITELIETQIISVNVMTPLKDIITIEKQYDLVSIPVINNENVLVGIITFDDIMDIIDEQFIKNIYQAVGLKDNKIHNKSVHKSLFIRLMWLIVGLCGGMGSAFIFSLFQKSLIDTVTLSFFTPVIMLMGGLTAIQSSTILLSDLMKKQVAIPEILEHLFKELMDSLITATTCSICLFLIVFLWQGLDIGIVILCSLFLIMNIGTLIGSLTPFILYKLNINPVLATGPIIVMLNDMMALLIYFSFSLLVYQ